MAGFKIYVPVLFLVSIGLVFGDDPAAITKAKEDEGNALYQKMLNDARKAQDPNDQDPSFAWEKAMHQLVNGTDDKTSDLILGYLADGKKDGYKPSDSFAQDYIGYYLEKVSVEGKTERISFILEKFQPTRVGWFPVDIAVSHTPDGILALFDTVPKLNDQEAKHFYIKRLRDDFIQISREHESDDEFLEEARRWYDTHKDQLKVNRYFVDAQNPQCGQEDFYSVNWGLFIWKGAHGDEKPQTSVESVKVQW